jgi:hypothetical protein
MSQIFIGVDTRTLRKERQDDEYPAHMPVEARKAALEQPQHRGGKNERQTGQNRIARQTKTWRNKDQAEAKQRARILYQLGLTPKPEPGAVALACAELAVGFALEDSTGRSDKILRTLAGSESWRGPCPFKD